MNGGDKILNRIKSDCDESIKAIEAASKAECDKIIAEAKVQADKLSAEISDKAAAKTAQINASSKSRAELELRNILLKKRRTEIDATVEKLKEYLLGLDDAEYFNVIYAFAKKLSGKSGTIFLNSKDLARLPADFEQRLKESGLDAKIGNEPADICGGFILKYGNIEENTDFSAVIEASRDRLEDIINRELFAD